MPRPTNNKQHSGVRIIAGSWRGRRIPVPPSGVRPTGDRVRETLFNWLQPYVRGARCLDLFAGTGVLGLEALSRGAERVIFVDQDDGYASQLREILVQLGSDPGQVIVGNAETLDYSAYGPFDIVFVDPPFGSLDTGKLCTLLEASGGLAACAHIYLEMPRQHELPSLPPGWSVRREKAAGQVRFAWLERTSTAEQE